MINTDIFRQTKPNKGESTNKQKETQISIMSRQTYEPCVKKAYQLCEGLHNKCDKGRGKNGKMYKATLLKSIIPTITPVNESIDKFAIVNFKLSDKEEY